MPLVSGARFGPYEILSSLGAGGMGEVYRARDPRLGREVAVKVIAGDGPPAPDRVRRFEQEARAVAALGHPGILAVHDVGTHDGQPYVVFELLEGETLRDRLQRGPLPPRKAVELAAQIGQGLAAAHASGVVHRDLKPSNLFLNRDARVKILDFGLAKLVEPDAPGPRDATATDTGVFAGTPGYAAPEQVRGAVADQRADIFALGAVLYEMATGRKAFDGGTAADTLSAVLNREPPPMEGAAGDGREAIPPALERVVRRCLEREPEERFQSARAGTEPPGLRHAARPVRRPAHAAAYPQRLPRHRGRPAVPVRPGAGEPLAAADRRRLRLAGRTRPLSDEGGSCPPAGEWDRRSVTAAANAPRP